MRRRYPQHSLGSTRSRRKWRASSLRSSWITMAPSPRSSRRLLRPSCQRKLAPSFALCRRDTQPPLFLAARVPQRKALSSCMGSTTLALTVLTSWDRTARTTRWRTRSAPHSKMRRPSWKRHSRISRGPLLRITTSPFRHTIAWLPRALIVSTSTRSWASWWLRCPCYGVHTARWFTSYGRRRTGTRGRPWSGSSKTGLRRSPSCPSFPSTLAMTSLMRTLSESWPVWEGLAS
mmetsp:Transcript_20207/g.61516  ORF Transcript_20207/g.61516 Transcript_20207/m.61516 type:complete len:233 (+) Transcript_20207:3089-3787(+)